MKGASQERRREHIEEIPPSADLKQCLSLLVRAGRMWPVVLL